MGRIQPDRIEEDINFRLVVPYDAVDFDIILTGPSTVSVPPMYAINDTLALSIHDERRQGFSGFQRSHHVTDMLRIHVATGIERIIYDECVRRYLVHRITSPYPAALGAKEAIPELIQAIRESDTYVQGRAAWALGELRAKEAVPDLTKLLHSTDGHVCYRAAQALVAMDAREAIPDLVKALEVAEEDSRLYAAQGLSHFKAKEVAPALEKLLGDPRDRIRRFVAGWLGSLGSMEGYRWQLEEGEVTPALNQVRQPSLYARLNSIPYDGSLRASRREVLEHAARQAGLAVNGLRDDDAFWRDKNQSLRNWPKPDLSAAFFAATYPAYSFVIEADRIILLEPGEAVGFWRVWWTEKKK